MDSLEEDPERDLLLAMHVVAPTWSIERSAPPEAREVVHRAVLKSRVRRTLRGHQNEVISVAWSADGNRLAKGSGNNTATVREAATGRELLTFSGHKWDVRGVAWSPDGKRLASAGSNGIVHIYTIGIDLRLSLARSRVTRNLTVEECRRYLYLDEVPPIPFSSEEGGL